MKRLLLVLAGCGALKTVGSSASYTTLWCGSCTRTVYVVGEPIGVTFDWLTGEEGAEPSLRWQLVCRGVPCTQSEPIASEKAGRGYGEVIPKAAGTLMLEVTYGDDLKTGHETYGPFKIVEPDRVELTCLARKPGTLETHACGNRVARGEDIRFEARAMFGDQPLPILPSVTLNGAQLDLTETGWRTVADVWTCGRSMAHAGAGVVVGCDAYEVGAGNFVFHATAHQAQAYLTVAIDR